MDMLQDATLHYGLKRQKGRKGQKVVLHQAEPTSDASGPGVGSSFRLKAPGCQLLVKWKSQEEQGVLKAREVLTQASHPSKKPNKIMGRVLTLFWKTVVAVLWPCELLSMKDLLHVMKKLAGSHERERRCFGSNWTWWKCSPGSQACNPASPADTCGQSAGEKINQRSNSVPDF